MSVLEKDFWKSFRDALKKHAVRDYVVNRVENTAVNGFPDVHLMVKNNGSVDIWVELKIARKDKTVKLEPAQKVWIRKRGELGGNTFLLVKEELSGEIQLLVTGPFKDLKPNKYRLPGFCPIKTDGTWGEIIRELFYQSERS